MHAKNEFHFIDLEKEVSQICQDFLYARALSYFHFRRNFKDGSFLILTNNSLFATHFLHSECRDVSYCAPTSTHQSWAYLWDECLAQDLISLTREKNGLYHGITLLNRYKEYYDCTAFAMASFHPSPSSYYLSIFHELKKFSEMFPQLADSLIKIIKTLPIYMPPKKQDKNRHLLFLPERSKRIFVERDVKGYMTTYELLCMKLFQEGKSYKEIGSILSISPRSVETYLARLKTRINLPMNNLLTHSFTRESALIRQNRK